MISVSQQYNSAAMIMSIVVVNRVHPEHLCESLKAALVMELRDNSSVSNAAHGAAQITD